LKRLINLKPSFHSKNIEYHILFNFEDGQKRSGKQSIANYVVPDVSDSFYEKNENPERDEPIKKNQA